MKATYKTALSGIISALCIVLMFLTSVIPVGTFAFPALAGILLVILVIECGLRWALCGYICVSILSFLLVTDKEAALYFTGFLGFYPIVKSIIERIKSKVLQFVIKYAMFNVCMIAVFFVSIFVLSIPKESFEICGVYLPWVFLAVGNIVFLLYDYCISVTAMQYIMKLRDKLTAKFRL